MLVPRTGEPTVSSVNIRALMKNESPYKLLYIGDIVGTEVSSGSDTTIKSNIEFSIISVNIANLAF